MQVISALLMIRQECKVRVLMLVPPLVDLDRLPTVMKQYVKFLRLMCMEILGYDRYNLAAEWVGAVQNFRASGFEF